MTVPNSQGKQCLGLHGQLPLWPEHLIWQDQGGSSDRHPVNITHSGVIDSAWEWWQQRIAAAGGGGRAAIQPPLREPKSCLIITRQGWPAFSSDLSGVQSFHVKYLGSEEKHDDVPIAGQWHYTFVSALRLFPLPVQLWRNSSSYTLFHSWNMQFLLQEGPGNDTLRIRAFCYNYEEK